MNRRDFLKGAAAAAVLAGTIKQLGAAPAVPKKKEKLVEVQGSDPAEMFDKAIAEFGGMGAFVKPGQKVVVKPNIGWDREAESGADTNPDLIGRIVRRIKEAGAAKVLVWDHTCDPNYLSCYKKSGIRAAVEANGGEMIPANREEDYREISVPNAVRMRRPRVHKALLEADVVINVPVLKNHGGAKVTAAMKNWMGVVWDRRYLHQHGLHQCIADGVLIRKPDLNILDAWRVMLSGGPTGRSPVTRSKVLKKLLISRDIVALDAMGCAILGVPQKVVRHIAFGEKHGLGTSDLKQLEIRKLS